MKKKRTRKKRDRKPSTFPGRVWLALGTIAAYTALGSGSRATLVFAQDRGNHSGSQMQLRVRRFDIHAGPLDEVLAEFEKSTGLGIRYHLPKTTIPGFNSNGVSGLYTQAQALKKILDGTGLSFAFAGQNAVTISVMPSASSVQVTASGIDNVAMAKFPLPLVDTPHSVTTITGEVLAAQGVSTLRDALRNAPGISLAAGEGGAQGDNLTIRGFSAQNDIFLDGMRDFGDYYRDPFNYQQIDVLEGPAGVEFGRGSTGGVINQESKVPEMHPFVAVDAEGGTDATRRLTADINRPLPNFAGGTAFRLNVMGHDANISERDVVTSRRYGIAPALSFGLNTPTHVTASYYHFAEDDIPDYGLPWYFGQPAPVPRHNYYGFSDRNFLRTDVDMGTIKAQHTLGVHGILVNSLRYAQYQRKWQITEPQVNNASAGTITPQTPLDQVMVNRNQLAGHSVESSLWDQADITFSGRLLGLRQTAVLGAEGGKETSDPTRIRFANPVTGLNTVPLTNLLDPDPYQPFSGSVYPNTQVHTTAYSAAAYLLDTYDLGNRWQLSGGLRVDHFDANEDSVTWAYPKQGPPVGTPSATGFEQDINKGSWRAALVYKLRQNGSVYFDYGTSFDPSAEALSLTGATEATPPEANETFELGSKWSLRGGRLMARGALFRTNKMNAREPDPNDSSIDVLSGNQRADGAEGVLQGRITDRWDILSSYTFLHAEVISSQAYPAAIGQPLNNVPENLFNLWTEYHPSHRLELGAGGNFVGARTANTSTLSPTTIVETAPGYWVFNAMARYEISEHVDLQANVSNLANRFYIDEVHPGHAIPGPGASALFGMKFSF